MAPGCRSKPHANRCVGEGEAPQYSSLHPNTLAVAANVMQQVASPWRLLVVKGENPEILKDV